MAEPRYAVAFSGAVRPDCDLEQVKAQLTAVLKLRPDHIEKLFSGQTVTVKRNLLYAQALRLQAAFDEAGALSQLVREQAPPEMAASPGQAGTQERPAPIASIPDPQSTQASPAAATAREHTPDPAAVSSSAPVAERSTGDEPNNTPISAAAPAFADQSKKVSSQRHLSPGNIAGLFTGKPQGVPATNSHRSAFIGAALATVLMASVYAVLVAAVGYITLWYALEGLLFIPNESFFSILFGYFLPLVLGILVLGFLLKPVIARSSTGSQRIEIDPLREPVLFALVHQVADVLAAPRPERICVDSSANATVGFSRGLPVFGGAAVELTIGIPLLAGMSARQFVGVLGHGFGHAAQGSATRAGAIIRRINHWFHRAVHERDVWDVKLLALREHRLKWVAVLFTAVTSMVDGQRKLLSGLHRLGYALSRRALRQMEFDADRSAACLVGSANFRDFAQRQTSLVQAYHEVSHEILANEEQRDLPEDIAGAIARRADELTSSSRGTELAQTPAVSDALFDAHPPDAERIARAEALAAPALFVLDAPAVGFLKKYDKLAQQSTEGFYQDLLGVSRTQGHGASGPRANAASEQIRQTGEALARYCGGMFLPVRFIAPVDWHDFTELSPEQRRERLDALTAKLRDAIPTIKAQLADYQRLDKQAMLAFGDRTIQKAGVEAQAQASDHRPLAQLQDERLKLDATLSRHEAVLAKRMAVALGGLIQEASEQSEVGREIARLLAAQGQLAAVAGTYSEIHRESNALMRLRAADAAKAPGGDQSSSASEAVLGEHLRSLVENLDRIKALLDKVAYPFSHAGGDVSVFAELRKGLPAVDSSQVDSVLEYARQLFNALPQLHRHVFSRMAQLADGYERGMGVAALESPEAANPAVPTQPTMIKTPHDVPQHET